jgi:hypothetical protein
MNSEIIFDKKYPVDEDGNIQIGEEIIKPIVPRKLAKIMYAHFNFPEIKPPKPKDATFGSVVENLDIILNRGYVDNNFISHRPYNAKQLAETYDFKRQALIPYQKALKALKKTEAIPDETAETKPKEKFVPVKKKAWLKQYGHMIEDFKEQIKRPEGMTQTAPYKNAEPHLYDLFVNWIKMTPIQFLQMDTGLTRSEKMKNIKGWLEKARDDFHEAGKAKAERLGNVYVGAGWKNKAATLRQFMDKVGNMSVGDVPKGHPLSQDVMTAGYGGKKLAGKYSHLKAKVGQIKILKDCLKEISPTGYFLFLLNLEMGLREKEAFTISATEPEPDQSGVREIIIDDKKMYEIIVRTRKGDWTGDSIHTGLIQDPELVDLISQRVNQVKEGMKQKTQKAADKFGVKIEIMNREHKMIRNPNHTLIGNDNEFYQIATLQNQKPTQKTEQTANMVNLEEKFRECYDKAGLTETYWTQKPFHSMRHIFAHYWLIKTDYDYEFVANLGHWKATTELKRSYGAMPNELFYDKQIAYHDEEYLDPSDFVKAKKKKALEEQMKKVYGNDMKAMEKARIEAGVNPDEEADRQAYEEATKPEEAE